MRVPEEIVVNRVIDSLFSLPAKAQVKRRNAEVIEKPREVRA